ncbi:MAG: type II toxin-antitoxin system RelE/ParE family toxin [Bacteroidia bacterium]|nr:type II toxin-antitoxin system RelE/ParE family toxin [Bacteroidia bacterium]
MIYSLKIDPRAIGDIQRGIDYYEEQSPGLGFRFEAVIHKHLLALSKNPLFHVRYDDVRCLPLQKFPFMIHFTVEEVKGLITIRAVLHTSLDPNKWKNG